MDANTTKRIAAEQEDDTELHDEDFNDEDEGMSEEDLEGFLAEAIEMYADVMSLLIRWPPRAGMSGASIISARPTTT